MNNKIIWKNAEVDSNDAIKPKLTVKPTEDEMRNALRFIRNWRQYCAKRKQELDASGGTTPDFMELTERLDRAETDISEALTLIANFDDL
jgi:hypothetical protein